MFVINCVELALRYQSKEMRKLKRGDAVRLEQYSETGNESVNVRHVREHVVGNSEVGLFSLGGQFAGEAHAEEVLDDVEALGTRRGRSASRRLNAEAGDTARFDVLQQIAVVGSDFDDMRCFIEAETCL